MKKKNILKNVGFFLLGILIWFLIDLIWDWKGNVDEYQKGYNDAKKVFTEENN